MTELPPQHASTAPPPTGRIDIHSHLLPGIDDGCVDLQESLTCVRALIQHGYSATICTPHCWPGQFPHIIPSHIELWVNELQAEIDAAGLSYRIYTGGEMRIHANAIAWMQRHGVPKLANSKFVLCDFWLPKWQKWIDQTFDWLMSEGYTPILAHPERSPTQKHYEKKLDEWTSKGVLLQGNFRCFTGEEGPYADEFIRQYMNQDRYTLLALDMHGADTLPARLDGIDLAISDFGDDRISTMIDTRVRDLIFAPS